MTHPAARRAMRAAAPWAATAPRASASSPLALVLSLALASLAAPVAAATAPPREPARPPLTNEDVVRLVVYGTKEEVILKEIASRPPAFDLDPGVVVELERVGVSAAIIDAMRLRQGSVARPHAAATGAAATKPSAETPPPAAAPAGSLAIAFAPSADGKPQEIFAIATMPKNAPRPEKSEIGTVSDLAIAILCTTGDHVPDHWDTLTPLAGAPRHELVLFKPGSHRYTDKGFELLALDRLPVGPVPLAAGHHALLVGLAGKQTGTGDWRLFTMATIKVDIADGKTTKLLLDARSTLSGMRMTGYHVEEIWTVRDAAADGNPPPAEKDAPTPAAAPATPP
jgi:hypothetical protein